MSELNKIKKPHRAELLMPAGSLERLKVAVLYGADAVYMGTPDMSLRTKSTLTLDEVVEGIEYAHIHGVKVYLTLNLFAHNKDIPKLDKYIENIKKAKPDGLIVADPGVFNYVKEKAPEIELHISTQANVTSWLNVKYWQDQGAKLVVLAREVSFDELAEIRHKCPDIKLETFVHGTMCMTYSGRCLLSNFMSERGANQGSCTNSCRWNYKLHIKLRDGSLKEIEINEHNADLFDFFLEEKFRPGELMPFEEDLRGSYILNSKDLCLMPKLNELLEIGVDSLKVEGRGKSSYYVGIITRAYRMAIDDYYNDPLNWNADKYLTELLSTGNRGFTLAFHEGRLKNYAHNYNHTKTMAEFEYAGIIKDVEADSLIIQVKNRLQAGDILEFLPAKYDEPILLRMYEFIIYNEKFDREEIRDDVHGGQQTLVKIPFTMFDHEDLSFIKKILKPLTIIRKEASLTKAEWQRLKLDKQAFKIENNPNEQSVNDKAFEVNEHQQLKYQKLNDDLVEKIDHEMGERLKKTPRYGVNGCCAKGCNGCLVFWQDEKYVKARKHLLSKKHGEMLNKNEISELINI